MLYEAATGHSPEKFPDAPAEWFAEEASDDALELYSIILKACEGQRERRQNVAYSEACRSAFRSDVDQHSEVMPISIPN